MLTANDARQLAELVDDINEALGQQGFTLSLIVGSPSVAVLDENGDRIANIAFDREAGVVFEALGS